MFLLTLITAVQPPTLSDMWGYHTQAIQWVEKYEVIPGLGHLCSKFAFNFGTFLPLALLSSRSVIGQPIFTINSFLLLLVVMYLIHFLRNIEAINRNLILLLTFFAVFHFFKPDISSTSVECSSALLILLLFFLYLSKNEHQNSREFYPFNWLILGMVLILPVIKLSNSPFVLLIIPLLLGKNIKTGLLVMAVGLIFWLPWLTRNVILTGYLWYPFPYIDIFNLDWKIPKETALQDFHWIRSWARIPFESTEKVLNLPWGTWLKYWASHTGWFTWFFMISGIMTSVWVISVRKIRNHFPSDLLWLWGVILLSIIIWFIVAPDPRFIISSLVLFTIIPMIIIVEKLFKLRQLKQQGIVLFALIVIFTISEIFIYKPLQLNHFIKPAAFPSQSMKPVSLDWITIYIPESGVNCYDHPLPCAPEIRPGLALRGKTLNEGFTILGRNNHNTLQ